MINTFMKAVRSTLRSVGKNKMYYGINYYSEKIQSQYSRLEAYKNISSCDIMKPLATDSKIAFFEYTGFENDPKKYLKKKYGKPNHTIVNDHLIGRTTILIYRILLGKHKTTLELHFFENQLVMYTYRFSYLYKDTSKSQLINLLKKKYQINTVFDYKHQYIVEEESMRRILVSDSVDFTINYMNFENTGFIKKINSALQKSKQIKKIKTTRKEQMVVQQL
ncbi:MAG: hypothetical protein WBG46_12720 [Nonlabens sp.]